MPVVQSEIDGKIGLKCLKSNWGAADTGVMAPVGIRLASVGVKAFALIWTSWFSALPEASPARLK